MVNKSIYKNISHLENISFVEWGLFLFFVGLNIGEIPKWLKKTINLFLEIVEINLF